jgi:hypothetical protein
MPSLKLQPESPAKTAEFAAANAAFLKRLWSEDGQPNSLRNQLFEITSGPALRDRMASADINITLAPASMTSVQILLVDVEGGRSKPLGAGAGGAIDPNQNFYVLVLPSRPKNASETDWQAWIEASFHAANDSYGM